LKTENIADIYELTPLQKGILFHSLYAPEFGLYFIQIRYSSPKINERKRHNDLS
jgi:hypothetical protein